MLLKLKWSAVCPRSLTEARGKDWSGTQSPGLEAELCSHTLTENVYSSARPTASSSQGTSFLNQPLGPGTI